MEDRPVLTNEEFLSYCGALPHDPTPSGASYCGRDGAFCLTRDGKPFWSGANGAITGDMLTTAGITVEGDQLLLKELGFEVKQI